MIIPGAPNPLMWGQGDPLDELGVVTKSVRLRQVASASFSRVWSTTGSRTRWTMRILVKRGRLSSQQFLFGVDQGGGNWDRLEYMASDAMAYNNGATGSQAVVTSAVYRDPLQWDDIVLNYDSTNATQADRAILTRNGVRQSHAATTFALNQFSSINVSGTNHFIGGVFPLDGYIGQFCFIDDKVVPATAFGQFHPLTGQWRPKTKSAIRAAILALGGTRNGWGSTGCFLPFDDATSTTTLGYDRSQSDTDTTGNNWTANNISLTAGVMNDSLIDTPTDCFATLDTLLPINQLDGVFYAILPSDGNLKITGSGAPPGNYQSGTIQINYKTAFSMLVGTAAGTHAIGIKNLDTGAVYWYQQDGAKSLAGSISAYGSAYTTGDRVAALIDPTTLSLEFFKQAGGTGGFISQGVIALAFPAGRYVPFFYASNGTVLTVDFGQQSFSPSSISTDCKPLSTKNLPRPKVPNPRAAFVAVTGAGSTIEAALAAERAAWGGDVYLEWFKRRDASEGHRLRFSDDLSNYLDTSTTNAKAPWPGLTAGGSYVGYAFRLSTAYGMATGKFAHTNGASSTVTDNLNRTRKAIILHRESVGGGAFFFYHPDLTAGKLLYLNSTAAETTDASINTVLANSFVADASLPSGTYRWWTLGETEGLLKLFKHTGNALSDGPFDNLGFSPALDFLKNTGAGNVWIVHDAARSPYNLIDAKLALNYAVAENDPSIGSGVVNSIDHVSNGIKVRNGAGDINQSGWNIVGVAIAAFPFRYANAR